MSVSEEPIKKSTGRYNAPLECLGCTNSPIYCLYRIHTYINFPNKMDPYIYER